MALPIGLSHGAQLGNCEGASQVTTRAKALTRSDVQSAAENSKRMLRNALAIAGWSQAALATHLGCTPGYVSRRLSDGERDKFTAEDIDRWPEEARTAYANLLRAKGKAPTGLTKERHLMLMVKELGELGAAMATFGDSHDETTLRRLTIELNDVLARGEAMKHDIATLLAKVSQ